jgi:nucleoside-diphosphate-sugar epimerase/predicted dehydrogenase
VVNKTVAMPDSKKFRTAIVGCGRISTIHIEALKALRDVEIVAVCDLDEKLARARASEHGIPAVFTDIESMMAELRPDVVHILTPPRTHLALTKIAAKYKAHIYAEKPLACTEADARAILQVVQESGIKLCPGHSLLFESPFREACRRVQAGEIGRIISVHAEQGFTYEAAARGAVIPWSYTYDWGIFDNIGTHPLYLASHFLKKPSELQVTGLNLGRVREAGVEEIRALIPSENAIGEVAFSLCNSPEVSRVELVGTRGRIIVDFIAKSVLTSGQSGLPGFVSRLTSNFSTALQLTKSSIGFIYGIATGKIKRYMGVRTLIAEFYRSLRDDAPLPVTAEAGLLNVRQMEQIKNACRNLLKERIPVSVQTQERLQPRVLVTGASGFLGGHLVKKLSESGTSVRATARLLSRAKPLPGVEWIQCDLSKEDDLKRALTGVETVFHCAAMVGPPGTLEDYEETNVKGTLRLVKLATDAGVENIIYVSSLSVYECPSGRNTYVDETTPYDTRAADRGVYTQTKIEAEKVLLGFINQQNGDRSTPRVIILRPGTIYGPGATLPLGRFPLPSSQGRPIITGSRRVPVPLTYIDNLIDAMLAAVESEAPAGSIYNVVDSADLDQGEVAKTLRAVSNGRIRPVFLPYPFVWIMMLGVDLISLVRHHKLGTARFRFKRTLADMRFPCAAARNELGWEPRVSLTEGLTRALSASTETPFPH